MTKQLKPWLSVSLETLLRCNLASMVGTHRYPIEGHCLDMLAYVSQATSSLGELLHRTRFLNLRLAG